MRVTWFLKTLNGKLYIDGYQAAGPTEGIEVPDNKLVLTWRDEYGNPLYWWDGEKPVLDPIPPTPGQLAERTEREAEARLRAAQYLLKGFEILAAQQRAVLDGILARFGVDLATPEFAGLEAKLEELRG